MRQNIERWYPEEKKAALEPGTVSEDPRLVIREGTIEVIGYSLTSVVPPEVVDGCPSSKTIGHIGPDLMRVLSA
ncbi:MAG: hypothetical protein HQ562_05680 [Candidatus Marinimicrobia bacterium]|nr:hypothetical protein [Candidatus Neomarinimicrobiota bacterium]